MNYGYIEVRSGFRQMPEYYGLGPKLTFLVHGGYEIHGELDPGLGRVYGDEIANWYRENDVRPGNRHDGNQAGAHR